MEKLIKAILDFFAALFGGTSKTENPDIPPSTESKQTSQIEHKRKPFLSNAEISFYHVLRMCISNNLALFTKPRVTDLISVVSKDRKAQLSQFNRLSKKHVDFVLCDAKTVTALLVIELDDSSHKRTDRQERDLLIDEAFQSANINMLRVSAKRNYSPAELKQQIQDALERRRPDTNKTI